MADAKNNLCKVAEDGTITGVDNPHPKWFDISHVFRPADRIAYVFGKVKQASAGTVGGAELAEELGVTAPQELFLDGISDEKVRRRVKLATQLAEIEQAIWSAPLFGDSVCNSVLDGIEAEGRGKNSAQVLKAMANQKIAMSLADFIRFESNMSKTKAEELAHEIAPALPNVFTRMTEDIEKLAEDISVNSFQHAAAEPSDKWAMWALKSAAAGSFDLKYAQRRAWKSAIAGTTSDNMSEDLIRRIKSASTMSTQQESIARAYALYKLAFLDEIKDRDDNFELTSDLIVRHNYII